MANGFSHPNVMRVFGDENRSRIYMVMEWCEGRLLRQILDEGRIAKERAIRIAIEILKRSNTFTPMVSCIAT